MVSNSIHHQYKRWLPSNINFQPFPSPNAKIRNSLSYPLPIYHNLFPLYTSHLFISSHSLSSSLRPPKPRHLHSLLLVHHRFTPISTLPAPPPSRPHIASTSTTTHHTRMNQPPKNTTSAPNPHERKHIGANTGADIQALLTCKNGLEYDRYDGRDDGCNGSE